jgi:toxin CptA
MRRKHNSSLISATFRCEWRPSRWQALSLLALSVLAPLAVALSDVPTVAAWPLALAAVFGGLALSWREWHRPSVTVLIPAGLARASVAGVEMDAPSVRWQGPLVILHYRLRGRKNALVFWPDTLSPAKRRELYLAMQARHVSQLPLQVAP